MSNFQLIAAKDVNYGASKTNTASNSATYPHELRDGAVGWFDASNNQLIQSGASPTVQSTPRLYLARGLSGTNTPIRTPVIDGRTVQAWKGIAYNSGQIGRQYVGFNGSNNVGINLVDAGQYSLTVTHTSSKLHKKPYNFGGANANDPANGFDIARETVRDLNSRKDSANVPYAFGESERIVAADVLVNTSSTGLTDGNPGNAITGTVRFNSATVELSATPGAATPLAAGDSLRIGSTSGLGSPVYFVEEINGTTVTLDRVYAGSDASGVALGYISGKPANSDEAGIQLESMEAGIDFHVALQLDFEGTPTNWNQRPVEPVNTYEKIKTLEEKTNDNYNLVYIPLDYPSFIEQNVNYDVYEVAVKDDHLEDMRKIVGPSSPLTIKIAVPDSPGTFTNSEFEVINNWFASSPLAFANVSL
jgi:hypothetical protein